MALKITQNNLLWVTPSHLVRFFFLEAWKAWKWSCSCFKYSLLRCPNFSVSINQCHVIWSVNLWNYATCKHWWKWSCQIIAFRGKNRTELDIFERPELIQEGGQLEDLDWPTDDTPLHWNETYSATCEREAITPSFLKQMAEKRVCMAHKRVARCSFGDVTDPGTWLGLRTSVSASPCSWASCLWVLCA